MGGKIWLSRFFLRILRPLILYHYSMKNILQALLFFVPLLAFGANRISFRHLTIRDGLSDSQINSITQDSQGFIWISTSYGLNRYDGYTFKVFTRDSKDESSLPDNYVEEVQEDSNGMLWVYVGRQRYVCYDPRKEVFLPAMPLLEKLYGIKEEPALLYIDKHKGMWIHNSEGTYYCDSSRNKQTFYPKDSEKQEQGIGLTGITEDKRNILLIYSNGMFEWIDKQTGKLAGQNDYLTRVPERQTGRYTLFADTDGDYWIYCSNGIWLYHTEENNWEHLTTNRSSSWMLSGDQVTDMKEDRDGRIWIAIDHGGINIIQKKQHTIEYIENDQYDERSLIQNSIYCLYCDASGGMWAGSYKRGISYYNESLFKFHTDHLLDFNHIRNFTADVNAVVEDKRGNLWAGTSNGLIYIDRSTKERKIYQHSAAGNSLSGDVVVSLLNSRDGILWIGTYRNGLCSFDGHTFKHYPLNNRGQILSGDNNVWALAEDDEGYIWIGTLGNGLYRLDPHSGKMTKHPHDGKDFSGEDITSICIGRDGNLYMGTSYGVAFYDPVADTFEKRTVNKRGTQYFIHPTINDIYEDSRGLLWIATTEGLNIYDQRTDEIFTPIDVEDIRNEIVQGIMEDNNKNMWITTTRGMFNVVVNVTPATGTFSFTYHKYDEFDELRNQQFNARAITRTRAGEIIAGGVQGLSLFEPENIKYNSYVPKVRFTELQLFDRDVKVGDGSGNHSILSQALPYTSEIKLKYNQNVFSISFSAMNYVLPQKTTYMYRLKGLSDEWLSIRSNKLTYTGLAPGEYTLEVKAINSDGFCSKETAALKIVITPPFWASPLAYLFYALLVIGLLLLARKYVLHNEKQKYMLIQIEQEARQKHEIDDMKLRFFTNISHELRTPLTLILSPLEYVIKRMDDAEQKSKLEMAYRNAVRLLNMVNQLLDFRKSDIKGHQLNPTQGDIIEFIRNASNNFSEYSERKGITLTFFSAVKELWMSFDQDKMGKIMMNLLSNAFKFTPEGGRVDVSLEMATVGEDGQERLEIRVSDNGIGISDEDKKHIFDRFYQVPNPERPEAGGSGIGLHLVKEFVQLHQGTISVLDNVGKGSVFIVSLPVERVKPQPATSVEDDKQQSACSVGNDKTEKMSDVEGEQEAKEGVGKRPVVLIVDDNDDFRHFMRDCLAAEYVIREASNGVKAWEMIPELQPDIIVSDVMMPEMDGNELCRRVKNDIRTSHILLILLTARSAQEYELQGLANGADDYITKPFNMDILSLRIKALLQRRRESYSRQMEIEPNKINITSLDEKLIKKAVQYVEEHMDSSDLSVEELSRELGMSRVHLYKKLSSITGKTPIEFIRIIRLKRAAQYLRESQLSISEVAYKTGFNNMKFFRKYFKEEFGVLPSEYQDKQGKNIDIQTDDV